MHVFWKKMCGLSRLACEFNSSAFDEIQLPLTNEFLPKASFSFRVLSVPAAVWVLVCVHVSECVPPGGVNPELVCVVGHHPLKLESPN